MNILKKTPIEQKYIFLNNHTNAQLPDLVFSNSLYYEYQNQSNGINSTYLNIQIV